MKLRFLWTKGDLLTAVSLCKITDIFPKDRQSVLSQKGWKQTRALVDGSIQFGYVAHQEGIEGAVVIAFKDSPELMTWESGDKIAPVSGCASMVHSNLWATYRKISPLIHEACPIKFGKSLIVTGHGIAGSLAALCALDLAFSGWGQRLRVVAFGAPPVGCRDFKNRFSNECPRSLRVQLVGDSNPWQIGSPYCPVGPQITLKHSGGEAGLFCRAMAGLRFLRKESISDYCLAVSLTNDSWEKLI